MRRWFAVLLLALSAGLLTGCNCDSQSVTIRWVTESEFNTAGFNLYRSEAESGPFDTKVNDRLIPAKGDPAVGGEYVYTDTQVLAGRSYFYQLEEVERNGRTEIVRTTKVDVGNCGLLP
jgi:hypothetical protein